MKKLLAILLSAIMLSTCCASLCACSIFGFSNTDIFGIVQPKISAYGNVIYWEAVADAAEYQVYAEGASIGTTTDTYYVLDDLSVDSDITVTAKNAQGKESKESNAITVQQSVGFVDEETMDIELTSEKEYKVSSNIKFVKVSGEASSVGFTIEKNRTDDLYVELDQVTMVSGATNNCFRTENNIMDAEELKFAVIFILKGNSALTGTAEQELLLRACPPACMATEEMAVKAEEGSNAPPLYLLWEKDAGFLPREGTAEKAVLLEVMVALLAVPLAHWHGICILAPMEVSGKI